MYAIRSYYGSLANYGSLSGFELFQDPAAQGLVGRCQETCQGHKQPDPGPGQKGLQNPQSQD